MLDFLNHCSVFPSVSVPLQQPKMETKPDSYGKLKAAIVAHKITSYGFVSLALTLVSLATVTYLAQTQLYSCANGASDQNSFRLHAMPGARAHLDRQIGNPGWSDEMLRDHFLQWVSKPENADVIKSMVGNGGGMRLFHAWFITFLIHALRPDTVIESGAHMGLGTRLIRSALGSRGRIIVVSPRTPSAYVDKHPTSKYFTNAKFQDFNAIPWGEHIQDKSKTLILFDDHQAADRRMREARDRGFVHLVFDDNAPPTLGDSLSPMQASLAGVLKKPFGSDPWLYLDNFSKTRRHMNESDKMEIFDNFNRNAETYFTAPPLWTQTGWRFSGLRNGRHVPKGFLKEPLLSNGEKWEKKYPKSFEAFWFMCYVKLYSR